MKKSILVLLTFVPVIVGYIINFSLRIPLIGMIIFYVLPLLTTVFWFYLGRQYALSTWKTVPALLIGNAAAIASLLIYLWQRLIETDQTANRTLLVVSQWFFTAAPSYLLARIAVLFEPRPDYIGETSMVALHVIAFVYMTAFFYSASFLKRELKSRINKRD